MRRFGGGVSGMGVPKIPPPRPPLSLVLAVCPLFVREGDGCDAMAMETKGGGMGQKKRPLQHWILRCCCACFLLLLSFVSLSDCKSLVKASRWRLWRPPMVVCCVLRLLTTFDLSLGYNNKSFVSRQKCSDPRGKNHVNNDLLNQ